MVRTPNGARALAKAEALDALPEAVQDLPEPARKAWAVRAAGGTWKQAAHAAGITKSEVWTLASRHKPLKEASRAAYLPLEDRHVATLKRVLKTGQDPEATDKQQDRALKAAVHVARGLGIGMGSGSPLAHAQVSVSVSLALPDVLGRALPVESAPLDVDAWQADASLVPVSSTQPSRARASSQRAGDAASDVPSPGQDGAE